MYISGCLLQCEDPKNNKEFRPHVTQKRALWKFTPCKCYERACAASTAPTVYKQVKQKGSCSSSLDRL